MKPTKLIVALLALSMLTAMAGCDRRDYGHDRDHDMRDGDHHDDHHDGDRHEDR